jgi:hypothetical protein
VSRAPGHLEPSATSPCSVLSTGEPAYGTATRAPAWVALEQPGPWGRDAVRQSHLDPQLGSGLAESLAAVDGRLALIRRPGAHADDHREHRRHVLVASCVPGRAWLLAGMVTDPELLLRLDLPALHRGDQAAVARSVPGLHSQDKTQLLVCTNGRRDVCCAVRGRPVAEGAAAILPGQVWETSHTGGHRFAPTAVLLPSGLVLSRLTAAAAASAVAAVQSDEFPLALSGPAHDRGRCALSAPAQAAESAVRYQNRIGLLDALRVDELPCAPVRGSDDPLTNWRVEHRDGRSWEVVVGAAVRGPDRPVSCGKLPEPQTSYEVKIAPATTRWGRASG